VWTGAREGAFGPVPPGEGWLHEDFHLPDKDAVFAAAADGRPIGAGEVVAASRVYTPRPIVDLLLQNTLGAFWLAMHPDSRLRERWPHLVPAAVGPARPPRPVGALRVLDPCCGAGAFLIVAARMLLDMAREEARFEGVACDEEEAARRVRDCLWGGDLDPAAVAIATREVREVVPPLPDDRIRTLPGPLGSFDPVAWPDGSWDVVVTNPPWVGARRLHRDLMASVRAAVGLERVSDLAVAMQRRCWDLTGPGGRCGTVTPAGWLNDAGARDLRRSILAGGSPRVVARLGQGVFDQAPLVFCAASVIERDAGTDGWPVLGADALEDAAAGRAVGGTWAARADVEALDTVPFAPSVPPSIMTGLGARPTVGDHFASFDGLWTGDNARDLRFWWEIDDPMGWARLSGGQGRDGWVSATRLRVAADVVDGRPARDGCIEYPRVAGGWLCARAADPLAAALAGIVTLVPRDADGAARVPEVLALFNSRVGTAWLRTLTSGLNFNPGYASRVPLAAHPPDAGLVDAVRTLCDRRGSLLRRDPTHDGFVATPAPWYADDLRDAIAAAESRVDAALRDHLGIPDRDWNAMTPAPAPRRAGSAREDHLMVTALRAMGMRWPSDSRPSHIVPVRLDELADRVADELRAAAAPANEVDDAHRWVLRDLASFHGRRFRGRPVISVGDGWMRPREVSRGGGGRAGA